MANEAAATDLSDDDAPTSEVLEDKAGRQWIAILVAPALFVAEGVGGAYVAGLLDPLVGLLGKTWEETEKAGLPPGPPVYFELPEMMVDLKSGENRCFYITLIVVMELAGQEDKARPQEIRPRTLYSFQS